MYLAVFVGHQLLKLPGTFRVVAVPDPVDQAFAGLQSTIPARNEISVKGSILDMHAAPLQLTPEFVSLRNDKMTSSPQKPPWPQRMLYPLEQFPSILHNQHTVA